MGISLATGNAFARPTAFTFVSLSTTSLVALDISPGRVGVEESYQHDALRNVLQFLEFLQRRQQIRVGFWIVFALAM